MSFIQTLLLTGAIVCSTLSVIANQSRRHIVIANTELSAGRLLWLAVCRCLGVVVELQDPPPWDSPDAQNRASICSLVRAVDGLANHMEKTVNIEHLAELKAIATRAKYVAADGGQAKGWGRSKVLRVHGVATVRAGDSVMIAAPSRGALSAYLEREGIEGHNSDAFDDVTITKRGES